MEGPGIEDDQPFDSIRIPPGPCAADGAAPVVHHQVDFVEFEAVHEGLEIGDPPLEGELVGIVVGTIRQTAPHVIRSQHPKFVPAVP